MKRSSLCLLLITLVIVSACGSLVDPLVTAESEPGVVITALSSGTTAASQLPTTAVTIAAATLTPAAPQETATTVPSVTPLPAKTATPAPIPPDLAIRAEDVFLYPAAAIYAGDKVTFQISPFVPSYAKAEEVSVHILVDDAEVVSARLGGRSHLSGEVVTVFEWVWDTSGQDGPHQVQVVLDLEDKVVIGDEDPDNNRAMFEVTVLPEARMPAEEANAIWKMAMSDCCTVHVTSRTAADRDLPELLEAVDAAIQRAIDKLGQQPQAKLDVYLVDRVIGQGGYAGSELVVSYIDRNYVNMEPFHVLTHEAVHILDRQFAPQRISFLAEGLAVWASGGHYESEDIDRMAAALVEIDRYIPLGQLVGDFYPTQHEIGYLEAAGLVKFLIDKYGWWQFRTFYADVTEDNAATLAATIDLKLREHYGFGLASLESSWLDFLTDVPVSKRDVSDLQTTIRYYDVMRHYQLLHDPTAHFLQAWLPSPNQVLEFGNPSDLNRHPEEELNITIEVMLVAANKAISTGSYDRAEALLDSVERTLNNGGNFVDPFSRSYLKIVQTADRLGYEVHQVELNTDKAELLISPAGTSELRQIDFVMEENTWVIGQ